MPTFTRSFGPATAQAVTAFEKKFGVKLPADYKQFLRTTNGGCPKPDTFRVPDRGDVLLGILYGIRDERKSCDLDWEQKQATLWEPLPPGMIAIGDDPGGNRLLLATLGKDAGRVYFWDRVGFWVREDGQNTFPFADSFTQFLAGLKEIPEDS